MNTALRLVLLISVMLFTSPVWSDWTFGVEGGSIIRDGDSATRIRFRASLDERPLSQLLYADWVLSGSESYELGYKPTYWFSDDIYAFGEGRLRIEDALSIDRDTLALAGIGLKLLTTRTQQVSFEAGLGYQVIDYASQTGLDEASSGVGVLRGRGSQVLSDLFKLELDADLFATDTFLESRLEAGISMRLQRGAVKLSYRVRRLDLDDQEAISDSDTAVGFTVGF